jgi:hypothetical protein
MNFWNQYEQKMFIEILKHKIPGTDRVKNLGRGFNEYMFDIDIEGKRYTVFYSIDSSD